jgi:hypothetical protein
MKNINRLGEEFVNNKGEKMKIIEFFGCLKCKVLFDSGFSCVATYSNIKNGNVNNPLNKSICNLGYLGVGKYKVYKNGTNYITWVNMLNRCYDENIRYKFPTYKNVTVCDEWHNFQNFAEWFELNYVENWHLDKDIINPKAKIYSPETCCFVPQEINLVIFLRTTNANGFFGITKKGNRYQVRLNKKTKRVHLGTYDSEEEAFYVYKKEKESYIKEIANKWRGMISDKVYESLINYTVNRLTKELIK